MNQIIFFCFILCFKSYGVADWQVDCDDSKDIFVLLFSFFTIICLSVTNSSLEFVISLSLRSIMFLILAIFTFSILYSTFFVWLKHNLSFNICTSMCKYVSLLHKMTSIHRLQNNITYVKLDIFKINSYPILESKSDDDHLQ